MSTTAAPRLFISYSWTSEKHVSWVIDLASRLRSDHIDVILDKWDLREGHDAHAFMESMVTDPNINKVALICDRQYVEKANSRGGGVGTEAQIITPQLYGRIAQDKFVAVITERDTDGTALTPAYYGSRIYIDLSSIDRYEEEYQRLVRWVYDKPLHERPPLGKTPDFITGSSEQILGNHSMMMRAIEQLRDGRSTASAALDDYLSSVSDAFETMRIVKDSQREFDDQVVESIDRFLTTRDQVLNVIHTVARFQPSDDNVRKIHRFFEKLLRYYDGAPNSNVYHSWGSDNFVFLTHELFLHTLAIFLDAEQFELASVLMTTEFFVGDLRSFHNQQMVPVNVIEREIGSLESRKRRLKQNRISLQSDLLKHRCNTSLTRFEMLAQADIVLYIFFKRAGSNWWPYTNVFLCGTRAALPIFARSNSTRYFRRVLPLLGFNTAEDFPSWIQQLVATNDLPNPAGPMGALPLDSLTNVGLIATKP